MNLSAKQIEAIAIGVARVEENDGKIYLLRYTAEQEAVYAARDDKGFFLKSRATAGVRLEFTTDSRTLSMETTVKSGSSRRLFSYEVFCNGKLLGSHGGNELTNDPIVGEYDLGEGTKEVRIYFPWAVRSPISRITLDDGAEVIPAKKSCKMLMYGDSITHGYDASRPSASYASQLADAMNANAINKAIGGETFRPALAELSDEIDADYITVAFGTNDWNCKEKEAFEKNSAAFYEALSRRNPKAKIFAITPIWRADGERITKVGEFSYVAEHIERVTADLPNVTVLHGIDLVPHDPCYFSDKYLHPNDEGFAHYFKNLWAELQKHL